MNILFDLWCSQPIGNSKFHGGGEFAKTIFMELVKRKDAGTKVFAFYDKNKFLDDYILQINDPDCTLLPLEQFQEIEEILIKEKIDVYFSPIGNFENALRISFPKNVKKICTIHGLRTIELPSDKYEICFYKNFKAKFKALLKKIVFKKYLLKRNISKYQKYVEFYDLTFTVSYHSKFAMKTYLNLGDKDIRVFYTPEDGRICETEQIDVPDKYILVLGGNRFEKNPIRTIFALDVLFSKNELIDYQVVIVGKIPEKVWKKVKNKSRFVNLGYVKTGQLKYLYENCDFFLYLSLNEGFGIPPLEAMKYGKTCVVTNICSVPEVCGGAVYYANPYNQFEIMNRILQASITKINPAVVIDRYQIIKQVRNQSLHDVVVMLQEF